MQSNKIIKYSLSIFLVLVIVFTRTVGLETHPSGFHNDEASFFYNALTLYKTGQDEDGNSFPLFLASFIDPKPALYAYLQIPFSIIFGETIAASRMPAALLGVGSVLLASYFIWKASKNTLLAIFFTFALAVSPWHIVISRSTQEVILSFFFLILSLIAFDRYLCSYQEGKYRSYWLPIVLVSALISLYSYHSAKVMLPLLIVSLLWYRKLLNLENIRLVASTMIIFVCLSVGSLYFGSAGTTRLNALNIFNTGTVQLVLEEQIRIATPYAPGPIIRAIHNKIINYGYVLFGTYAAHFSPDFLFLKGGEPLRYAVPFHGLLYIVELPLLLVGIGAGMTMVRWRRLSYLFLFWWLISPLPTLVTSQEQVSSIRTFVAIMPIYYFIALGILVTFRKRWSAVIIGIGYLYCIAYFAFMYAVHQPNYRPWKRNFADQVMARKVTNYYTQYETIIVSLFSGQPYVYLALEGLIPAKTIQYSNKSRMLEYFSLDKFTFINKPCPLVSDTTTLSLVQHGCIFSDEYEIVDKATNKDGSEGYLFVEYVGTPSAEISE